MNVYLGELYKEVEYIQSSWTQYIDTGYIPSNNTKLTMSMWWYSQNITYSDLFWARLWWSSSWRWFEIGREIDQDPSVYVMFWWYYSNIKNVFSYHNGNNHIIELSQSWAYEDWVLKQSISSATFTSPVPLVLFWLNDNGTVNSLSNIKLYYCQIYESWTLVRDFIPCYRVSDNVIWLFDKVWNKFYTNAGTGSFTKWNDVKVFQPELKNSYIGEYISQQTFTLSDVPTGDVNKYISIAKNWYKVSEVKFKYTNTILSNWYADNRVRISWAASTTNRYWIWFSYGVIQVSWRINWQDDSYFFETAKNTWTTNTEFTITRDNWTIVCSWANTLNYTSTMSSSEKNVVATIMNSNTINAYCSRNNWTIVSDVTVTVTYEPA